MYYPTNRRDFLRSALAAGAGLGIQSLLPSYALGGPLDAYAGDAINGLRELDLKIGKVDLPIGDKLARPTTINGTLPGPLLRFREGDHAVIRVANGLREDTSIHWHGILLPPEMDGVPGVSFAGIPPDSTFEYRFQLKQSGTYWYHSHSGFQEQQGVYGPLIVDPAGTDPIVYDREFVIILSDWTFDNPHDVLAKLKKQAGYYNYNRRTLSDLVRGEDDDVGSRLAWSRMRMDATDLADVTGTTYSYLINGMPPGANWTGVFKRGEKIRLRFINAGSATFFDVRIPGLKMTVVQSDGQNVVPVDVDEFRIALAETYDVIVEPEADKAYSVFAEAMDRSGYALATLAPREGMTAPIPERRKPARRTMRDMGMAGHEGMNMEMSHDPQPEDPEAEGNAHSEHAGHQAMAMTNDSTVGALPVEKMHGRGEHGPGNAGVPMSTSSRLDEPGIGLENQSHRVLLYTDLMKADQMMDDREPSREIELHLTGNMERYMWSFDGKKFSSNMEPIQLTYGERVRLTLINDTMMEHPIHLHGMWMELENGHGKKIPRKHTVNVKPAERMSLLITADAPGRWAMHCHILYHMEAGMFRVVEVSMPDTAEVAR